MSSSECPYTVGTEFPLTLTSSKSSSSTHSVRVRILQTYPFTKSQGMKVAILAENEGGCTPPLPQTAFLKLFDRRYLDDRSSGGHDPWNKEKEAKAKKVDNGLHQHPLSDSGIFRKVISPASAVLEYEIISFDKNEYMDELKKLDFKTDEIDQWIIEMKYRHRTVSWFRAECRAYGQLQRLQQVFIPEFYGTTLFDERSESPVGIETDVVGILMQFIHGISLEDVDPSDLSKQTHVGQVAVDCIRKIAPLGVLHGDVRLANIMITHSDPARVYLVDFAFAYFRASQATDDEWEVQTASEEEEISIKLQLHKKGLRDRTPPEPYSDMTGDYSAYNHIIYAEKEDWRSRYYELSDFEYFVIEEDEKRNIRMVISLPEWLPNYKAFVDRKVQLKRLSKRYWKMLELDA